MGSLDFLSRITAPACLGRPLSSQNQLDEYGVWIAPPLYDQHNRKASRDRRIRPPDLGSSLGPASTEACMGLSPLPRTLGVSLVVPFP